MRARIRRMVARIRVMRAVQLFLHVLQAIGWAVRVMKSGV